MLKVDIYSNKPQAKYITLHSYQYSIIPIVIFTKQGLDIEQLAHTWCDNL